MAPNISSPATFESSIPVVVPRESNPAPVASNAADVASRAPVDQASKPLARDCVTIWDVPFDRVDMDGALMRIEELVQRRTPSYAITANLNYCMLHERDPAIRTVTADADLIVADGQPIVWRSQLTERPLPERVAGSEMIDHLCRLAAFRGWRVYFLGGAEGVPQQAAKILQRLHPSLKIVGTESPPFRELTADERNAQIARIRHAKPDVMLVAFGQPKGDFWIHQNRDAIGVPFCMQIGASLDFITGTSERAPLWVQVIGMEWLHRMIREPKRLVPRYARNAAFLIAALWNDWRATVTSWGLGNWVQADPRRA